MAIDAIGSAASKPVVTITMAAMITSAEPIRSPSTSRYAPRRLIESFAPPRSTSMAARLARSPSTATTSIGTPCTSCASPSAPETSRPIADTATDTATTMRITPFTRAPSTSARRYP